jgi:uncharacterized membrane protein
MQIAHQSSEVTLFMVGGWVGGWVGVCLFVCSFILFIYLFIYLLFKVSRLRDAQPSFRIPVQAKDFTCSFVRSFVCLFVCSFVCYLFYLFII